MCTATPAMTPRVRRSTGGAGRSGCKRLVKLSVKCTVSRRLDRVGFQVWLSKSPVGLSKSLAFQPVLPPEEVNAHN
jgi:hypothetical protein